MLLCSLLLGFGLDAWVCLGTDHLGLHPWVLTRSSHHAVIFWEPSSGDPLLIGLSVPIGCLGIARPICLLRMLTSDQ